MCRRFGKVFKDFHKPVFSILLILVRSRIFEFSQSFQKNVIAQICFFIVEPQHLQNPLKLNGVTGQSPIPRPSVRLRAQ